MLSISVHVSATNMYGYSPSKRFPRTFACRISAYRQTSMWTHSVNLVSMMKNVTQSPSLHYSETKHRGDAL